ncbi:Uncharacterized protein Adt_48220 [Abeliophyllum distichum]|uniref:Uncharacterized protein n=1 Tax=Abeliophyllum distichum TaxID=126358 RepID=A0ABD1NRL0_9LAMI
MVEEDLTRLREEYRIPSDIDLILPGPNERACFPRRGCTALHLNAFVSGMRPASPSDAEEDSEGICLSSDPGCPKWMESDGGGHVPMVPALVWHGNALARVPNSVPAEEVAEEERQRGGGRLRVVDDPEPDLDVPSVYGIASSLPRCELSRESIDVLRSIYQADSQSRSYSFILNRQRCLRKVIEDLSRAGNKEVAGASNVIEVDDAPEVEVPLSRKRKAKSVETGASQARGVAVDVENTVSGAPPLQRTLAVNQSGEVVLEGPSRPTPTPGSGDGGPFDSKRRLQELIGAPGARIPDDALRGVPFYPSMGAQAVKKYFTPKWEEFSSHGELEDVLEASLASAIRASSMQMKVLGEFRTQMQE